MESFCLIFFSEHTFPITIILHKQADCKAGIQQIAEFLKFLHFVMILYLFFFFIRILNSMKPAARRIAPRM